VNTFAGNGGLLLEQLFAVYTSNMQSW